MHRLATAAVGVNKFLRADAAQRSAPLNAPAPDAGRLRAELGEQQVAELKAALANMEGERDRWRTLAERRSLLHQRAESNLARSEMREWWWRLTEGS